MSEATTTPEIPEAPDTATPEPETETEDTKSDGGNREAAKYRRQLRDTEAERDALAQQLSAARDQLLADALGRHRDLGKGAAGCRLKVASDLSDVAKVDPAGLFTDAGLDDAKLTQTLADLHARRPDLFEQPEWPGMGQGKQGSHLDGTDSFTKAFSHRKR